MHQIGVMDFVSHQEITLILICRSAIQRICLFDIYQPVPFIQRLKISST